MAIEVDWNQRLAVFRKTGTNAKQHNYTAQNIIYMVWIHDGHAWLSEPGFGLRRGDAGEPTACKLLAYVKLKSICY
jgi:hypothetical protein